MWLRCQMCERTLLTLEQQVTMPFVCSRCREENPNTVFYESLKALPHELSELERLDRIREHFEYKMLGLIPPHEVVIDMPMKEPTDELESRR